MEPATKRRKTGGALTDTDEDELFLEPEELNQRRDPSFLLAKGRAEAAFQLKSRFEDIFAKYEKDFTGIGDEIDLETGEVVVDNGHLSSMRSMKDWIVEDDEEGDGDGVEDGNTDDHQDRNSDEDENEEAPRESEAQGHDQALPCVSDENRPDLREGDPRDPWRISELDWPSGFASRGLPLLDSLLPTQSHFPIQNQSFPPFVHESSRTADPAWQAPELPPSAFLNMSVSNARHYGGATPGVTRTVLKKSLNLPNSPEADIEDDLQTASVNVSERENQREPQTTSVSPLIHRSFPAVDSSPHDNNLKDLIQDVISSMPDTPPSIRRSRLPKAQGKPSPLNQEHQIHQIHQRTESRMRLSNTPLLFESRGPPKKRGRKPKVRATPEETLQTAPGDQADQSPWKESDLESFRDITSQGFTKPAGQTLYVHIEGRKVKSPPKVMEGMVSDQNANDIGFVTREDLPMELSTQYRESSLTLVHQGQNMSHTTELEQSRKPDGPKPGGRFKRNVVDPTFVFSDEENLLPRRSKKKEKLQSKHSEPSNLPSPPLLEIDLSQCTATENNIAVDREKVTLAPDEAAQPLSRQRDPIQKRPRGRPKKRSIGGSNAEQVTEATTVALEAALETRKSKEPQVVTSDTENNNTKTKQQRRQSVRSSRNPDSENESAAMKQNEQPLSSTNLQENLPIDADRDMHIGQQDSSHVNQETEQSVAEADAGTSNDLEIPTGQSDLPEDQHLAPASPERVSPAEPQLTHPTTPSRPRAKRVEKHTPSFNTSVLSLISESDDDEDELSFDHSDYTPSGHHRILVHRPFPEIPTTPRFSASSKSTKKRNSLLPSRSQLSSSHRISKPPQTPRSTGSDKAGNASRRRGHRKGHQLARSVVRVARRTDGNEDRESSVLQTPGGTKRRCGEDGWKCDRDFCFVCME